MQSFLLVPVLLFLFVNPTFSVVPKVTLYCVSSALSPTYNSTLKLAVQNINNSSSVLPDTELVLEIISRPTVAQFISVMMNLRIDKNVSLVIGNEFPSFIESTGTVGSILDIAQISSAAGTIEVSNKVQYPYVTRVASSFADVIFGMTSAIKYYNQVGGVGWTDVAVLASANPQGITLAEFFIETAEKENINVVMYQQFLETGTYEHEFAEVKKSGARVLIAFVDAFNWESFIVPANDTGLVGDNYVWMTGSSLLGSPLVTTFPPEIQELTRGVAGFIQNLPDNPVYDDFFTQWQTLDPMVFRGAGNNRPIYPYPLLAYDMTFLAAYAIDRLNKEGAFDHEETIPAASWFTAIQESEFDGITGHIALDVNGDRVASMSMRYYDIENKRWPLSGLWSAEEGFEVVNDFVWFSNTTAIPDLDIRDPFYYWSCDKGEKIFDPTGKTISLHTPDQSSIDDIDSDYHCDQFIDCWNLSDESSNCSENYTALFITFGIIAGTLILIACCLIVFVLVFGMILRYQKLRALSPVFLIIMLVCIVLGFLSVFAWFGKPHPVACAFQPWLLGLPIIGLITALCVKTYRIWRIFRSELQKTKISDFSMFVMWNLLMLPPFVIIVLWMIISTPTASMQERNGIEHYVCSTGGFTGEPGGYVFFSLFVAYGTAVLIIGIFLSIVTRNVPSAFNESKLLAISIYNLGFLSVVIIPVFLVVHPLNPFISWILRTVAILYAFAATMSFQFITPVVEIIIFDRFQNKAATIVLHSSKTSMEFSKNSSDVVSPS